MSKLDVKQLEKDAYRQEDPLTYFFSKLKEQNPVARPLNAEEREAYRNLKSYVETGKNAKGQDPYDEGILKAPSLETPFKAIGKIGGLLNRTAAAGGAFTSEAVDDWLTTLSVIDSIRQNKWSSDTIDYERAPISRLTSRYRDIAGTSPDFHAFGMSPIPIVSRETIAGQGLQSPKFNTNSTDYLESYGDVILGKNQGTRGMGTRTINAAMQALGDELTRKGTEGPAAQSAAAVLRSPWMQTPVGLVGDVLGDPLTWTGVGAPVKVVKGISRAVKGAKAAGLTNKARRAANTVDDAGDLINVAKTPRGGAIGAAQNIGRKTGERLGRSLQEERTWQNLLLSGALEGTLNDPTAAGAAFGLLQGIRGSRARNLPALKQFDSIINRIYGSAARKVTDPRDIPLSETPPPNPEDLIRKGPKPRKPRASKTATEKTALTPTPTAQAAEQMLADELAPTLEAPKPKPTRTRKPAKPVEPVEEVAAPAEEVVAPVEEAVAQADLLTDEDDIAAIRNIIANSESVSNKTLQRDLKISFARVKRALDSLQEEGLVGPANKSGVRQVLSQAVDTVEEVAPPPAKPKKAKASSSKAAKQILEQEKVTPPDVVDAEDIVDPDMEIAFDDLPPQAFDDLPPQTAVDEVVEEAAPVVEEARTPRPEYKPIDRQALMNRRVELELRLSRATDRNRKQIQKQIENITDKLRADDEARRVSLVGQDVVDEVKKEIAFEKRTAPKQVTVNVPELMEELQYLQARLNKAKAPRTKASLQKKISEINEELSKASMDDLYVGVDPSLRDYESLAEKRKELQRAFKRSKDPEKRAQLRKQITAIRQAMEEQPKSEEIGAISETTWGQSMLENPETREMLEEAAGFRDPGIGDLYYGRLVDAVREQAGIVTPDIADEVVDDLATDLSGVDAELIQRVKEMVDEGKISASQAGKMLNAAARERRSVTEGLKTTPIYRINEVLDAAANAPKTKGPALFNIKALEREIAGTEEGLDAVGKRLLGERDYYIVKNASPEQLLSLRKLKMNDEQAAPFSTVAKLVTKWKDSQPTRDTGPVVAKITPEYAKQQQEIKKQMGYVIALAKEGNSAADILGKLTYRQKMLLSKVISDPAARQKYWDAMPFVGKDELAKKLVGKPVAVTEKEVASRAARRTRKEEQKIKAIRKKQEAGEELTLLERRLIEDPYSGRAAAEYTPEQVQEWRAKARGDEGASNRKTRASKEQLFGGKNESTGSTAATAQSILDYNARSDQALEAADYTSKRARLLAQAQSKQEAGEALTETEELILGNTPKATYGDLRDSSPLYAYFVDEFGSDPLNLSGDDLFAAISQLRKMQVDLFNNTRLQSKYGAPGGDDTWFMNKMQERAQEALKRR